MTAGSSGKCPFGYGDCPVMGILSGYAFRLHCDSCVNREEVESSHRDPNMRPVGFS